MFKGKFIVVEGLDRAGKSTQCSMLADVAEFKFAFLECPDRTSLIGDCISAKLKLDVENDLAGLYSESMALHYLFVANRWEMQNNIREKLNAGENVVCARYTFSGAAYDAVIGISPEKAIDDEFGNPSFIKPDLVIYLDIDPEVAALRENYGHEIYDNLEFQHDIREKFTRVFKHCDEKYGIPAAFINVNNSDKTAIHEKIVKIVRDSFAA